MNTRLLLFTVTLLLAMQRRGVCSEAGGAVEDEDCSYQSLLKYLKLDKKNEELAEMRPVKSWKKPTQVHVDIYINAILDVDAKSQSFTTFVTSIMTWTNDFLTWNPEHFCGLEYIAVPREKLWKPDLAVAEEIADTDVLPGTYAVVYKEGITQVLDKFPLKTSCAMNVYKFPFDRQTCNITFHPVVHRVEQISLHYSLSADELSAIAAEAVKSSLAEWEFVSITRAKYNVTKRNHTFNYLKYTITLQRMPLLYIINLVVPVTFFLILDLATFFISASGGEKLGFKVTLLLSISVLLLIMKDILPGTAFRLPLIALHCVGIFLLTGLSLLETMLVCFLLDIDNHDNNNSTMASPAAEDAESSLQKTEEETSESPEKDLDMEQCLSDPDRIKHLLDAINTVYQQWLSVNVQQEKRKSGYYATVVRRLDTMYAVLYLINAVGFLAYIFTEMTKDYILSD